jgi:flagellar hook-basal body complex protein FliE
MNDLTISNLQTMLPETPAPGKKTTEAPSAPFSDYVQRSLADVNRQMIDADKAVEDLATGKNQGYTQYDDLHEKSRDLF